MRQQAPEQTGARPVSNYTDGRHQNSVGVDRQQRDKSNTSSLLHDKFRSGQARGYVRMNPHSLVDLEPMPGPTTNNKTASHVKFSRAPLPKAASMVNDTTQAKLQFRNHRLDDEGSDTGTELEGDSLYDDEGSGDFESQAESVFSHSKDIRASMDNLSKGIHKVTKNYIRKVKKQVDSVMSKVDEKQFRRQVTKPPQRSTVDKLAATQELLTKLQIQKKKIYDQIDANLKTLKHLDMLTDELHVIAAAEN